MFVIVLFAIISVGSAGVIPHHHEISHSYPHSHGQATSYQSVKISNYHPVPVYLKKEHHHLLQHPVEAGHTATSVQVHHGREHDHGYAQQGYGHQEAAEEQLQGGQHLQGGYEDQGQQQVYQGYEEQQEYGQHQQQEHEGLAAGEHEQLAQHYDPAALQGHSLQGHNLQGHELQGHLQGQGLQAYATHYDHGHAGHQEAAGYEQEAAGYEQAVEDDAQHQQHYQ